MVREDGYELESGSEHWFLISGIDVLLTHPFICRLWLYTSASVSFSPS